VYYDYDELLKSFGHEVVLKVDERNYQGDSWVIFRDGGRYGYLCFGWGSCSGCDALQACQNEEDVEELRQKLRSDTRWFDDAEACLDFFYGHDWEGDHVWHAEEFHSFLDRAKTLLYQESQKAGLI
jgi:hypothetical protein